MNEPTFPTDPSGALLPPTLLVSAPHPAGASPADVHISPNADGLPGIAALQSIVGAAMTIGLVLSVLALIISAIVWGFGTNSSNPNLAAQGKMGVVVACGAAVLCGAAVTLVNFFWHVGQTVS